jgi:hypothetical protein
VSLLQLNNYDNKQLLINQSNNPTQSTHIIQYKMASQMTPEEANKVIEEEAANDDDFKDAVEEEEIEGDKTFEVTPEELSLIRAELASDFPEDYDYLSDAYILSVASKPYSKDPSVRRPIEVSRRRK